MSSKDKYRRDNDNSSNNNNNSNNNDNIGVGDILTTSLGVPISDNENSETVGPNGPTLLQDVVFLDKMAHFDRERIPERVVHAKGAAAHGHFRCYKNMSEYTCADFLQDPDKNTPVFVRFSTVIGSKGSADTVRDPRGFATKFYTDEGNYDIVGNDIPVFFIRDAIKFPDVIHSLKPAPNSNLVNPTRFWDFISQTPEATHMITWLYSDRGTIKSYRHIDGFGVNTFIWVNSRGKRRFVKFHWKTQQGLQTIDRHEASMLSGLDPDIATRDLYEAIEKGDYPKYELCVQLMDIENVDKYEFDPLDDTKTWPEDKFPLMKVGMMTLDRNPDNFFAETEQVAFCPANIVRGVEFSADKMLQGRVFSYSDTQRYRVGPNFAQLPINRPKAPVHNNQQDGAMRYFYNKGDINYKPNTLDNNMPQEAPKPNYSGMNVCGEITRQPITKIDDFTQAGERYHSLSKVDQDHLIDNIVAELWYATTEIQEKVTEYFMKADRDFGIRVMDKLNLSNNNNNSANINSASLNNSNDNDHGHKSNKKRHR